MEQSRNAKPQIPSRMNLDTPAYAPGPLPTPPGMMVQGGGGAPGRLSGKGYTQTTTTQTAEMAVLRDKKMKELQYENQQVIKRMNELKEANQEKGNEYKDLAKETKKISRQLAKRADQVRKSFGTMVQDAGGTTYFGADLGSFVDSGVGAITRGSEGTTQEPRMGDRKMSEGPKRVLSDVDKATINRSSSFAEMKDSVENYELKEGQAIQAFLDSTAKKLTSAANEGIAYNLRRQMAVGISRLRKIDPKAAKAQTKEQTQFAIQTFNEMAEAGEVDAEKVLGVVSDLAEQTGQEVNDILTKALPSQEGGTDMLKAMEGARGTAHGAGNKAAIDVGIAKGTGKEKDMIGRLQAATEAVKPGVRGIKDLDNTTSTGIGGYLGGYAKAALGPKVSKEGVTGDTLTSKMVKDSFRLGKALTTDYEGTMDQIKDVILDGGEGRRREQQASMDQLSKMYVEEMEQDGGFKDLVKKFGEDATMSNKEFRQAFNAYNQKNVKEMFRGQDLDDEQIQANMIAVEGAGKKKAIEATGKVKRDLEKEDMSPLEKIRRERIDKLQKQVDDGTIKGQSKGDSETEKARKKLAKLQAEEDKFSLTKEVRKGRMEELESARERVQEEAGKVGSVGLHAAREKMQRYKPGMKSKKDDPLLEAMIKVEELKKVDEDKREEEDAPLKKRQRIKQAQEKFKGTKAELRKGGFGKAKMKTAKDMFDFATKKYGAEKTGAITEIDYRKAAREYINKDIADPKKRKGPEEMQKYEAEIQAGMALAQEKQAKAGIKPEEVYDIAKGKKKGTKEDKAQKAVKLKQTAAQKRKAEVLKRQEAETRSFMSGVVGQGITVGKGQSKEEAFLQAAAKKHGTRGEKVWEDEEGFKRYQEQRKKAAKMYAKGGKGGKGGKVGPGKGEQAIRQSQEMEKQASGEMQAAFASQEVQQQREAAGMGGGEGGGGGGGGFAEVVIRLDKNLEGTLNEAKGLLVTMASV